MADLYGVIWSRIGGAPRKLADMVLTPIELRITRHHDGMAMPGFSMLHDLAGETEWVWSRALDSELPPQLQALLPPQIHSSPIRKLMYRLLDQQGIPRIGRLPIEQEWLLLTHFGAGGIGHLDVFLDDAAAHRYYASPESSILKLDDAKALWACLRDGFTNQAAEDHLAEMIGKIQVSGVSGMMPKLFTSLDHHPVMVKIEPPDYPCVLALESLALELHRAAGLEVPNWQYKNIRAEHGEIASLVLSRYDRTEKGLPLPQESFFTLLRTGARSKYHERTDGSMETLFKVVETGLVGDVRSAKYGLFQRLVMALATGNGDLHSENFALIGSAGTAQLAPVFDPAPMRAYRHFRKNHDLLSALSFAGVGGVEQILANGQAMPYTTSGDTPEDLNQRVLQYAKNGDISVKMARDWICTALEVTKDYADAAADLLTMAPSEDRRLKRPDVDGFRQTVDQLRKALGGALNG
ncbi:HipA domain-containing protein [Deefgea tanakiae]|uniref:HipA domain-containing protein n=1 Tax=Deefgea tanakiae TaxID=2865840 RepID=A0ABX8Z930_9NEIS|nr:HipA domain-containing protein [Deefgea tanakiae]QZA77404.1 HipA domain-containing protein [Deefgea tanakiae]